MVNRSEEKKSPSQSNTRGFDIYQFLLGWLKFKSKIQRERKGSRSTSMQVLFRSFSCLSSFSGVFWKKRQFIDWWEVHGANAQDTDGDIVCEGGASTPPPLSPLIPASWSSSRMRSEISSRIPKLATFWHGFERRRGAVTFFPRRCVSKTVDGGGLEVPKIRRNFDADWVN